VSREGVVCRLRLEEFSSGIVRPTSARCLAEEDRLAILRATGAFLSCIFGLYARPGERLRDVLGGTFDAPRWSTSRRPRASGTACGA